MARGRYRQYTAYKNGNFVYEGNSEEVAKRLGVKIKSVYNMASSSKKNAKKEVYRVEE